MLMAAFPTLADIGEYIPGFSADIEDDKPAAPAGKTGKSSSDSSACINNMKSLGYGLIIYADNHSDNFPSNMKILLDRGEITEEILENMIYLGHKTNLKKVSNPATYPAAMCGRFDHADNVVHILFSDGHTESLDIPADADENAIIEILNKKYKYTPEELSNLKKSIAEY
jgi:hypothetical protein